MKWILAIPVYGERYWRLFEEVTLPRLIPLLSGLDLHWLIYTDRMREVDVLRQNAILPRDAEGIQIKPDGYQSFIEAHHDAYSRAEEGDAIAFLCADSIFSRNSFHYAAAKIAKGALAIVVPGPRTLAPEPPRIGASSEELRDFAMHWPHPSTRETFFPWGRSIVPTNIYFTRDGESVVLRAMHLHPFVVVKRSGVTFKSTVDDDLLESYPRDRIHIVQNGEMASIEMSPPEKTFGVGTRPMSVQSIANCYVDRAKPIHRWYFDHPIRIAGTGECGDGDVVEKVKGLARRMEAMAA